MSDFMSPGNVREEWLQSRREAFVTPDSVVRAAVASITRYSALHLRRLTGGEVNETYRVETDGPSAVIVRIARKGRPWFEDEADLIAAARRMGVPTPEVLGIEQLEHEGELLSISIQACAPGRPLDELASDLARDDLERLVSAAGELLALVHTVPAGQGQPHRIEPPAADAIAELARIASAAVGRRGAMVVESAAAFLGDRLTTLEPPAESLVHGDWSTKHFLIDNGRIACVIDWEQAGPGSPAVDLALWDVVFDHQPGHGSDVLLRGYCRVTELSVEVEAWRPVYSVDWLLEMMSWYDGQHLPLVRHCVRQLEHLVGS